MHMIFVYREAQIFFSPAYRNWFALQWKRQFCIYYQFIFEFLICNIVILWIIFYSIYSILMNEISKIFYMCPFYISIKFICMSYIYSESESRSVVSNSLQPHGLYSSWNSPGQNTGMGSRSLLQGIFPTQGLSPGLLHYRWILY